jgi:hypothetical protein
MAWIKQIRGPYMCYTVEKDFLTSNLIEQKPFILPDLQKPEHDVALDIRKLRAIDVLSLRFLANMDEMLEKKEHHLVLVGGEPQILSQLLALRPIRHFPTMADFEREFHDLNPALVKSILQLAQGGVGFKMLQLQCPLCHFQEVSGFVLDESKYNLVWSPSEIVPIMVPSIPEAERIDFSCYRVAVCPSCFFASSRPDHFGIRFPEGEIKSILKPEQITNLHLGQTPRKAIAAEYRESSKESFFHPPRDADAGFLSWKLHEACQKQISQDRRFVDAFEIVLANFMMCKYASNDRVIDDHLHTALAWLNNVMQNQDQYSSLRLQQAYTFYVSGLLAIDKVSEAHTAFRDFEHKFKEDSSADFWLQRAESLISESSRS